MIVVRGLVSGTDWGLKHCCVVVSVPTTDLVLGTNS